MRTIQLFPLVALAACATSVHADHPRTLPVDVARLHYAAVLSATVHEGYLWDVWPGGGLEALQAWDPNRFGEPGRHGEAIVLLGDEPVGCDALDAPPPGMTGLFFFTHWWTTTDADPDWVGEYTVGGVPADGDVARIGQVGSFTDAGAVTWREQAGTVTLDAWGSTASGQATLDGLDAHFVADVCPPRAEDTP